MAFPNENQHIVMVTGKGGVGKSAVAAAMARVWADNGKRCLLVELGEQSYFSHVLGQPIGYEPVTVRANLDVALWDGEVCLREYVLHLIKIRKLVDLFFSNRVMKTFIRAAPALKELAILGKITSGIRQWGPPLDYDIVVVDAYATGHFLALLRAPLGIAELIESGPMGEQTRRIQAVLKRADLCRTVIVTLAEELPATEAVELRNELTGLLGYSPPIICNRYYEPDVPAEVINAAAESGVTEGEKNFAGFLKGLLNRQSEQMTWLRNNIGETPETLPYVLAPNGKDVIEGIAPVLGVKWKNYFETVKF